MSNFKPKQDSKLFQFLMNPLFHLSLMAMIVVSTVVFIKQRQQAELQSRIEFLRSGPVVVTQENLENSQSRSSVQIELDTQDSESLVEPQANGNSFNSENLASQNSTSSMTNAAIPTSAISSNTPNPTNGNEEAANSVKNLTSTQMKITYLEVDRQVINRWFEQSRATGQVRTFENVSMGPLIDVNEKIKPMAGVRILQTLDKKMEPGSSLLEWFTGTQKENDPEQMGLYASVMITENRDGLVRGDIEIQRAFSNPLDASKVIERVSYGSSLDLVTNTTGYMIAGLLPPRLARPFAAETNPDPYLEIFKSQNFLNGQTEFTLVIQFVSSAIPR